MNAYLSSTTLWKTPANLFGTAPAASSEWGSDGATVVCVCAAILFALFVAARALEICVERRRERRRQAARARKRRAAASRAAVRADFWKNNGNSVNYASAGGFDDRADFSGCGDRDGVFVQIASFERRGACDEPDAEEERWNNRRDRQNRRGKKEARAERRFAGPRVAAFWTVVALGLLSVLPTLRSPDAPADLSGETEKIAETTFATSDDERRWSETDVEFRAVANSEDSRWEGASLLQDAENARVEQDDWSGQTEQNSENGQESESGADAANLTTSVDATDGASLIVERRASSEGAVPAKTRWVQTADGKLTAVAQIRAESSIEIPAKSLNSEYPAAAQAVDASATSDVWRRRPSDRLPQTSQNGQVGQAEQSDRVERVGQVEQVNWNEQNGSFAQPARRSQFERSTQDLPTAQDERIPAFAQVPQSLPTARPEQISRFEQTAQVLAAPNDEAPARLAQTRGIASTPQVGRPARTSQAGQVGQVGQAGQVGQVGQVERLGQTGGIAQGGQSLLIEQTAKTAQIERLAQVGQVDRMGQTLQTAQNAQAARRWQNASSRDAVVASVYDASRGFSGKKALAREFAPSAPLIPYPSEERRPSIASVSYDPRPVDSLSLLEQIDAEFQRIGARVRKSVLSIETAKRAPKTKSNKNAVETGCGFLFQYRDKIYLATNMHVVKDAASNKNVKLFLPDRTTIHPTKILTCADFDLAALELDPATLPNDGSVALCYFGDSDELQVSNFVGTIGNPFGLRDTVTYGHVSSLQRRKNDFTTDGEKSLLEFVQIDASINPGNSGGPLYNARGEVVGVVAAIATTTGKSEGVAFAIPINLALTVLKSTIDAGGWSRSRMGVELETATSGDFQGVVDWPFKSGSRIVNVAANSPAERAGLRGGDVVVEFEGEPIEDDQHLARLIAIADVSKETNLKILRGGKLTSITARLERSVAK